MQASLARYRAESARMYRQSLAKAASETAEERREAAAAQAEKGGPVDVLSPHQHDRLAVLFASFSAR